MAVIRLSRHSGRRPREAHVPRWNKTLSSSAQHEARHSRLGRRPRNQVGACDGINCETVDSVGCLLQDIVEKTFADAVTEVHSARSFFLFSIFLKAQRNVRFNSFALAPAILASTTNSSPAFLTEPFADSCLREHAGSSGHLFLLPKW